MGGFDWVMNVGRVVATTLKGTRKAVTANVEGIDDESATEQPLYGAIGLVCRPLAANADGAAEVLSARMEDGLRPFAGRDTRLNEMVNPKDGEVCLVGYGGGFISLKQNATNTGTDVMIYAPRPSSNKASAISIDTTVANNHVSIVHESGVSITLTKDREIVLANVAGDASITIGDNGIVLTGKVNVNGSMIVGNPLTAGKVMVTPPLPAPQVPVVSTIFYASATP
jgi:hypothetical protein